ncbi:MAG: CDP-diacylglycerol--glycerol-3-phosphate 3-phosphatidyltransferase, partial [Gammaproteobacteria bacterium]
MNLPNALTLSRIILIPVFVLIFYMPVSWHYTAACMVFVLAAITDGLDGYYARKLGQTSALGAFLDPVADKLMIAVVLVLLVEDEPSIWLALPAAVIIGREITISALREWMAELGESSKVAVSGYGKLKTI